MTTRPPGLLGKTHHRVGRAAPPTVNSLGRPAKSAAFEASTIETEYGEELRKAYEEARQWIEKRPDSLGGSRQGATGGFLTNVWGQGVKRPESPHRDYCDNTRNGSDQGTGSLGSVGDSSTEEPSLHSENQDTENSRGVSAEGISDLGTGMDRADYHTFAHDAPWYVIEPHNPHKVHWDVFVAFMIIYSVLVIPWRIAFSQEATGFAYGMDVFIDCCFVLDIILTFFTGFYDDREVFVASLRAIAWRYLTSYFMIDLISVVPIDRIAEASGDDSSDTTSARITRVFRLVRLMKLGRLFRLKRLQTILEEKVNLNPQVLNMLKVIGQVVFFIHLLACLCFWLATPICPDGRPEPCDEPPEDRLWSTWVRMKNVDRLQLMSRYLASFHLVTATIMAVGYGDLHPTNAEERLFSLFVQLIGAIVFGFILSAVTTLIESTSPRDVEQKLRMNQLKEWLAGRDLPSALRHRVWAHYLYLTTQKSIFKDEADFLVNLPTNLRVKIVEQTRAEYIQRLRTAFGHESRVLITEVAMLLRPSQVMHYECLVEAGEPPMDIFFVKVGRIEALLDEEDPEDHESAEIIVSHMHPQLQASGMKEAWSSGGSQCWASSPRQGSPCQMSHVDSRSERNSRLRSPSPPPPLHLPSENGAYSSSAELNGSVYASHGSSTPHAPVRSNKVATAALQLRHHALPGQGVLCAIYREGDCFGEVPVSPVRLEGGDLRSEVLALCKDALHGLLSQFPFACERHEQYQKENIRGLWQAITSEEHTQPVWSGGRRRRLKSLIFYEGQATPVNEMPPEALMSNSESPEEHEHESEVFPTRRKDPLTGRTETRNETESDLFRRGVIPPHNKYKIRWDFYLGALIFYSVLIIPYRFGFGVEPHTISIAIDIVVDIFFFLDMAANFRCGFLDAEGRINTILPDIRGHYLRGWFIVDFLSTFPIDRIMEAVVPEGGSNARAVKLIRFARLFRLLKLARVFKLGKLTALANSFVEISPILIRMVTLILKICFMAHIVGCFWFYLTSIKLSGNECETGRLLCDYQSDTTNWLKELGSDSDIDDDFKRYIVTIYWVFTTMTTVGYGDIVPTNDLERAYAVMVMIFGATVFGYIIGSIAELSSGQQDAWSHSLSILRHFCEERGLNQRTQSFMTRHYQFWYQEMTPLHDEPKMLAELPPSLRKEVIIYMHQAAIKSVALFRRPLPDWFVATMVRMLEPQAFPPGSDIIGPDEAGLYEDIIFIHEGACEAYRPATMRLAGSGGVGFQANVQSQLMKKRRKRELSLLVEEEEKDNENETESDEELPEDEVVEVLQHGEVWGFEPLLRKIGAKRKKLVCLRCCLEEPCFVYALRHGMLSEFSQMHVHFGCMVQEVLADTIIQQVIRQGHAISSHHLNPTQLLPPSRCSNKRSAPTMRSPRIPRSPAVAPQTLVQKAFAEDPPSHPFAPDAEESPRAPANKRNSHDSSAGSSLRVAALARSDDIAKQTPPLLKPGSSREMSAEPSAIPIVSDSLLRESPSIVLCNSPHQVEDDRRDIHNAAADSTGATRTPQGSFISTIPIDLLR